MRNEFEHGRLVKQTFADGKAYTYSYYPTDDEPTETVTIRTPDDRNFVVDLGDYGDSTVRERDTQPKQQGSRFPE